jgi:hypothetical protein
LASRPTIVTLHGFDRAAAYFRDRWTSHAEQLCLLLLAPEFDVEAFPDAHAFNYGNVRSGDGGVTLAISGVLGLSTD